MTLPTQTIKKTAHAAYDIRYHFVFATKYRKPIFIGPHAIKIRDLIRNVCSELKIEILKGVVQSAGNAHDSKTLIPTISNQVYYRIPPFKTIELDAVFDAASVRNFLEKIGYYYRISANKRRGPTRPIEKMQFRWSVERTHSWINRSRRLIVRWEKSSRNYLGLLQFACQIIVFSKI